MALPDREELLRLDVATRLQLIEELWDSIASDPAAASQVPLSDAERALLEQRLEQRQNDPTAARPWASIRAQITKPR
ncbi:MAG: addiction module protein [Deltaproteobacteria bacterium]|nr:addiction module protein [Deltaproteobacteria bacterium]